jgi:hypothetical protein
VLPVGVAGDESSRPRNACTPGPHPASDLPGRRRLRPGHPESLGPGATTAIHDGDPTAGRVSRNEPDVKLCGRGAFRGTNPMSSCAGAARFAERTQCQAVRARRVSPNEPNVKLCGRGAFRGTNPMSSCAGLVRFPERTQCQAVRAWCVSPNEPNVKLCGRELRDETKPMVTSPTELRL